MQTESVEPVEDEQTCDSRVENASEDDYRPPDARCGRDHPDVRPYENWLGWI